MNSKHGYTRNVKNSSIFYVLEEFAELKEL